MSRIPAEDIVMNLFCNGVGCRGKAQEGGRQIRIDMIAEIESARILRAVE